jgi:hypothetical protein
MGWGVLIGLVILFQVLIYYFHKLRKRGTLTRWRVTIGVTAFFSLVFFVGSTGLSNFSWKALTVWCGLTLLQVVATYLLAPILGIR